MRNQLIVFSMTLLVILGSSCASILSKSSYPISIRSTPSLAKVSVTDKKGFVIYQGNTPATLYLDAGNGYFSRAKYQVKIELAGYEDRIVPVHFKIDGWYWGNLLFGGAIGFLIVDPATGAMYKLKTLYINETLSETLSFNENENGLKIFTIDQIPNHWIEQLVKLED
tara:strand:- start:129 stop:632 length:504 start_codon:yes stop_codon:yes gene_type:complete